MPDTLVTSPAPEEQTDTAAPPEPSPARLSNHEIIHDAFMLGWQIVELKSRIKIALLEPVHLGLRLASIWRGIFNRITTLQTKTFPESTTAETLYDPPSKESLPYLYPPEPDYANLGIPQSRDKDSHSLKEFKLHEVTRRAINCLTLLYVDEKESLVPDLIRKYQDHLVGAILKAAQDPGSGGGNADAVDGGSGGGEVKENPSSPDDLQKQADLREAKKVLTERATRFLEAWEGYLRENYYIQGQIPDDESELIAYEAGHSMSLLTWNVSVMTVEMEQLLKEGQPVAAEKFIEKWQYVFRDQAVIHLQHQISSLSSSMDVAYLHRDDTNKQPDNEAVPAAPDPNMPSLAIQAVKQSIDYWHRMVKWLATDKITQNLRKKDAGAASFSNSMRLALIEQANIWQTLMTGQQNLNAFTIESVTHKLLQDVTEEIQNNLRTDFKGSMKQAKDVMKEMATEAKEAITDAGKTAVRGLEDLFRSTWGYFLPVIIVLVIIFLVFILNFAGKVSDQTSGNLGFLGSIVSAIMGLFGLNKLKGDKDARKTEVEQKQETAKTKVDARADTSSTAPAGTNAGDGLFTQIRGVAQETGNMIMESFKRGYEQIRVELAGLSRSVAVSYPLVEFFERTFEIKSNQEFLTEIIWSSKERAEEIKRVTSAAFGPLSVFMMHSALENKEEINTSKEKGIQVNQINIERTKPES